MPLAALPDTDGILAPHSLQGIPLYPPTLLGVDGQRDTLGLDGRVGALPHRPLKEKRSGMGGGSAKRFAESSDCLGKSLRTGLNDG